ERIQSRFTQIEDHVLLPLAGDLNAADAHLRPRLDEATLTQVVNSVPDEWFFQEEEFDTPDDQRRAYTTYLQQRLNGPRAWLQEATEAQRRGPKRLERRATHRVV